MNLKIGILTFHRSINYGAFMQCYSLSKRLQADFPEASIEVIDYTSSIIELQYRNRITNAPTPEIGKQLKAQEEAFCASLSALPLSSWRCVSDDPLELAAYLNEHYDIVIVGSDAVWNWNVRGFPNGYFLKDYHGKKLSYAASAHGQSFYDMTPEQKQYLSDAFHDFSYIGVRDCSTEKMLHYIDSDLDVHHNCDPTLLLEMDLLPCDTDLLKTKLERSGIDLKRPIVGLMASGDVVGKQLRKYMDPSVQFAAVYAPNQWADAYLYDLSPFEWAKTFSYFGATVTHFFHGTLLSLVNGTAVFPVELGTSYTTHYQTKINDVLTRMNLLNWYRQIDDSGIIKRGLKKCGIPINGRLWKDISEDVTTALLNRASNAKLIQAAVQKEKESYNAFKHVLQKCIDELKEKKSG